MSDWESQAILQSWPFYFRFVNSSNYNISLETWAAASKVVSRWFIAWPLNNFENQIFTVNNKVIRELRALTRALHLLIPTGKINMTKWKLICLIPLTGFQVLQMPCYWNFRERWTRPLRNELIPPALPLVCFIGDLLSLISDINMRDIGWATLWEFPIFSQRFAEHWESVLTVSKIWGMVNRIKIAN